MATNEKDRPQAHNAFLAEAQARIAARRQARAAEVEARLASSPKPLARIIGFPTLGRAWDAVRGREGTRPAFRVGQVDAELLDAELLDLLRGRVGEAVRLFPAVAADAWDDEIALFLRAALFKLGVWDNDASYGAALQGLRYTDARHGGPVPRGPTRWQKVGHGVVTVLGTYAWSKWEAWLVARQDHGRGQDDQEDKASDGGRASRLARLKESAVPRLARATDMLTAAHATAALASFLVFLVRGRCRTLLDHVLRMRLAPRTGQVGRELSFEYLNRQLVWHALTEFLLLVLPLVGLHRWRRWLARAWRRTKEIVSADMDADADSEEKKGALAFLPDRTCAVCYEDLNRPSTESQVFATAGSGSGGGGGSGVVGSSQTDVTNPYEAIPCGCVYCFVCLATRIEHEEGQAWACLRCGGLVKECRPWGGHVLPAPSETTPKRSSTGGAGKTVGFADDVKLFDGEESKRLVERPRMNEKGDGHVQELDVYEFGHACPVSDSESDNQEAEKDEEAQDSSKRAGSLSSTLMHTPDNCGRQ